MPENKLDGFTGELVNKLFIPILLKLFQKIKRKGTLPKSLYCHTSVCSSILCFDNKDLERWTLKPSARHSSRVFDKPRYSS